MGIENYSEEMRYNNSLSNISYIVQIREIISKAQNTIGLISCVMDSIKDLGVEHKPAKKNALKSYIEQNNELIKELNLMGLSLDTAYLDNADWLYELMGEKRVDGAFNTKEYLIKVICEIADSVRERNEDIE